MSADIRFTDGQSMKYEQIRLLDNGWAKCTETTGGDDYIPPHRIENITGRVYVGDGKR
jgi:hypothetical protein